MGDMIKKPKRRRVLSTIGKVALGTAGIIGAVTLRNKFQVGTLARQMARTTKSGQVLKRTGILLKKVKGL